MEKRCSNLVLFSEMPPQKHRELSAKGGRVSGASRREKRSRIDRAKEQAIAEKELKGEELYLLAKLVKELRRDSLDYFKSCGHNGGP